MPPRNGLVYEFGGFRLDRLARQLSRGQQTVSLSNKCFDLLVLLVQSHGEVLARERIMTALWPDTFVEEGNLTQTISVLRKALAPTGDLAIETIPRVGYRFNVPVTEVTEPAAQPQRRLRPALVVAALSLILILVVAWLFSTRTRLVRARATAPIRSIAVLPLQNLSGDSAQEYFSDGITDALVTSLAQIRGLKVISRTSIMRYRNTTRPIPDIGRDLGVDAILEGSVQREKNRVRITVQLIQAATDTHLWAQSYERDLSAVLQLESEIATVVAKEVEVKIGAEARKRLDHPRTVVSEAQDEYLMARHEQDNRTESHLKTAVQHYQRAIQLAPDFAEAYAGLAHAWVQRGVLGSYGFRESEALARQAAFKAIELDPNLAEAHSSLAHVLMFYDMAWASAEQEFRRAIELDLNNVDAHVYFATLLEILGRFQEAIEEGKRSLALDPVSTTVNSEYGRVLFRARRFDESIRQYQRTLELDQQDAVTRFRMADALVEAGRPAEALEWELKELRTRETSPLYAQVSRTYARLGRTAEAKEMAAKAESLSKTPDWLSLGLAYFELGDRDRGFRLVTRAFDDRRYVNLLSCDPRFDRVRDDPRFRTLLHRLGLPHDSQGTM